MASDGGGGAFDAPGAIDAGAVFDADPNRPDADPNTPDANVVDPMDATPMYDAEVCISECLINDQYRDCDNGGNIVDCPLGCGGGTPHCFDIDPSNGADANDLAGVTSGLIVGVSETASIDSDTGQVVVAAVIERAAVTGVDNGMGFYTLSPTLAVLAVDSVSFGSDSYVRVNGTRALIILSRGDIDLAGFIDLAGGCTLVDDVECAGAGGGRGATPGVVSTGCGSGGNGGGGSPGAEAGGGGGALGQAGARGGHGDATHLGGAGGTTTSCPGATLVPLVGGSGGGIGGVNAGGIGGGGGGALQLTSYTSINVVGTIQDQSAIWAGGAGGGGAFSTNGGGGGGAGGALLLEAPAITISQALIGANGGGGGGGSTGEPGEYGGLSTARAAGGAGTGNTDGGQGGAAAGTPTIGQEINDGAGGGGGGAGIIRLNVPISGLTLGSATISPVHTRADPAVL